MFHLHEKSGNILPFTLEKTRITVLQFIICDALVLITGTAGLATSCFITSDEHVEFLEVLHDFNSHPNFVINLAAVILIIIGVLGIVLHILGYPRKVMYAFSLILMVPFWITLLTIGESSVFTIRTNEGVLERIEALESNYYFRRGILKKLTNDEEYIGKLQKKFQCCGLTDNRDWLLSTCNCLPKTCCRKEDECEINFIKGDAYQELGLDQSVYKTKYRPLIWNSKCLDRIQMDIEHLKRRWILFPIIYLIIQSMLTTWTFHITFMINSLLETPQGFAQLQVYRAKWPNRNVTIKPKYKKLTRESVEMRIPLSSTSSDPGQVFEKVEVKIRIISELGEEQPYSSETDDSSRLQTIITNYDKPDRNRLQVPDD